MVAPWFPLICLTLALDVQIRDEVGVPAQVLDDARRAASTVFGRIGVSLVWLAPADARRRQERLQGDARDAFLRSLFTVRIISATDRALGSSSLNTRQVVARYPAVDRHAAAAGVSAGPVLGHVIAHELGHLLLNRAGHSPDGLMARTLDTARAAQGRFGFTEVEARTIRSRLASRRHGRNCGGQAAAGRTAVRPLHWATTQE